MLKGRETQRVLGVVVVLAVLCCCVGGGWGSPAFSFSQKGKGINTAATRILKGSVAAEGGLPAMPLQKNVAPLRKREDGNDTTCIAACTSFSDGKL